MTALSSTDDKVRGFEVGAVDYVTKPIQPEEVLARIKLHLQLRFMNQTLAKQNDLLSTEIEQRKIVETRLQTTNDRLEKEVQNRLTAKKALHRLNQELEKRVEQRTIELKRSNQLLHQEINERKQVETQLRNSLQEKEVLLKEIYHRVKNNLLVVSSMLEIQANSFEDPKIIKSIEILSKIIGSLVHADGGLGRSGF